MLVTRAGVDPVGGGPLAVHRRSWKVRSIASLALIAVSLGAVNCSSDAAPEEPLQSAQQPLLGCDEDDDCDDGKPCTVDVCLNLVACVNLEILDCCLTDVECHESLGCLLARCVGGECVSHESCGTSSQSTGVGGGGGLSTTGGGGTAVATGSGGSTGDASSSSGGTSATGAGGNDGNVTQGTSEGSGGSANSASTTSAAGGNGPGTCDTHGDCAAGDCEVALCLQGTCASARDPLCCDTGSDCEGIRCATGDCASGRCEIDAVCQMVGAPGAAGATGSAGAAGDAGAPGDASAGGAGGTATQASAGGSGGAEGTATATGDSAGRNSTGGTHGDPTGPASYEVWGGACSLSHTKSSGAAFGWLLILGLVVLAWCRRRTAVAVPIALAFCGAPGLARAQGSALDEYPAPTQAHDLLWVERAAPEAGEFVPNARLAVGYTKGPLVARGSDGSELRLIDQRVGFYLSAGASLWERFVVALAVPVYSQTGDALPGAATGARGGLGELGVDLRAAILGRSAPVEFALAATTQLPTGDEGTLTGDNTVSARPRAIATKVVSERGSLVTLHLGSRVRDASQLGDVRLESELDAGVGGLYMLTEALGFSAEVGLRSSYRNFFDERETPVSGTGGLRYRQGWVVLHAGAGAGLTSGVGAPELRLLGMAGVAPPVEPAKEADADGDGIADARDNCPRVAEDMDGVEDGDGCPEDNDRDGVPDTADKCPNQAEDMDGWQDSDGCPDPDNDGDGFVDGVDKCPTSPEDNDGNQDDDGCPEPDNDLDGCFDKDDKCPDEAEDLDGWQDEDGCPDPDNDGDGILDVDDQCPKEPETKNGVEDEDGCPDLVRVEQGQIRTLEPIFFEFGRAQIQRRSEPMLAEMARTIAARPDLGRISVEGHTDNRGADQLNQRLSEQRALAVLEFLVSAGVAAERLTSAGFGESQPITTNDTAAGRAKNRRVEFRFVIPEEASSNGP